ncbi:MAG TPA: APC family permease [Candidatus Angelobacter sp.]|nr:APC family permease [Candidatus Angelobacter sp.]
MSSTLSQPPESRPQLVRGLTLFPATALNMVDMVGVGPFITLPLIVAAMGGAQAIFGWIAGAVLAMSDGLIWAELGAAMPRAGGSYEYLDEIYGRKKLGRMLSFLFVFQLVFSAPVSMATGCLGLANYASYLPVFRPLLGHVFFSSTLHLRVIGDVDLPIEFSAGTILAMAAALLATFLVYRGIAGLGRISKFLWVGVMAALAFVIFTGLTHFHLSLAFPPGWTNAPPSGFWAGFSAALLIAAYDYWGYYNVCFLGEEVVEPQRTIPRSMLLSIVLVAILYIAMNVSLLGVLPAKEMAAMAGGASGNFPAARAAEVVYGSWGGTVVSILVMWTAFASVFSLLAGYSRIPFAAARDGNFFSFFRKIHPEHKFPVVSVLLLGGMAGLLCVFQLKDLVSALVVIRIMLLFAVQAVGAVVWRYTNPDQPRPFRMWLYPLPVVITLAGFALILVDKRALFLRGLLFAGVGIALYLLRSAKKKEWPFSPSITMK